VKTYSVVFTPEARDQLAEIYRYVAAESGSPDVAAGYTEAIVAYCEELCVFPLRGRQRDDVRAGLRVTSFRRRVVIAYAVDDSAVSIIGVFHGGQDYESALEISDA
jgi:toxin ParE1/3/4